MLGGLDALGRTRQEQENDARSARWRQDELIDQAKYRPQMAGLAGAAMEADAKRESDVLRQQGINAGINTQRRDQDMTYGAKMAQMGLAARAQEQDAAMGNAKLGIDMARFGLEQSNSLRQQAARDALGKAMASGDEKAINQARSMAMAAGVELDRVPGVRDRFLTLTEQDANGNKIEVAVDPSTGRTIRPQSAAPDRPVGTTSKVGDRVAVWDGSKWVEKS